MEKIDLLPKDFHKNVTCPGCGHNSSKPWYRFTKNVITQRTFPNALGIFTDELKKERGLLKCNNCSLVYQYLIPTQDLLKYLYSSSTEYKPWPPDPRRLTWNRAIKNINNAKNILDVGANDGHFLSLLPDNINKFALEPTNANNVTLEQRVKKIFLGFIDGKIDISEKFDYVTMFDVAEHLSDVPQAFKNVNSIMDMNGTLIIESGDSGCFVARLFKSLWWYTDYIEHFVFFNKSSLNYALKNAGFEIVSYERVIHTDFTKEYSVSESYKQNLVKLAKWVLGGKFKKKSNEAVIHHPFRLFCKDHFFVIAKKIK